MSGLDPHMIKLWKLIINGAFTLLYFDAYDIWDWYKLTFISNCCLIKLDQLKMLTAQTLSAIHYKGLACLLWYISLAEYSMCSRLLFTLHRHYSDCCSDEGFEVFPGEFDGF